VYFYRYDVQRVALVHSMYKRQEPRLAYQNFVRNSNNALICILHFIRPKS